MLAELVSRTETDLSGLPTPVSAGGTTVDLAKRMDEEPGSRNRNLPGVEYALGSVGESAAGLNSRPASPAAGISADTSLVAGSEGGWILPGVPTWVANVLTGCSPPEASIKRCSAELLASTCSEGDDAWPGLGVNGGGLFGGPGLSAGSGLRLSSLSSVSGSTSMPASIAPTWRATFRWGSDFHPNCMAHQPLA